MVFDELEYGAVQAEKRDKMQARWNTWTVLGALISAFGLAGVQPGSTAYVVILYPLLAACLARFSGHSEHVLDQLKAYLLLFEKTHNYQGYEYYNRGRSRSSAGGHTKALRDAIMLTDLLVIILIAARLILDHLPLLLPLMVGAEMFAAYKTWTWLRDQPKEA